MSSAVSIAVEEEGLVNEEQMVVFWVVAMSAPKSLNELASPEERVKRLPKNLRACVCVCVCVCVSPGNLAKKKPEPPFSR